MKNNYPYLRDVDFLKELAEQHVKEYFAKIIVLNWNEQPIQDFESRVLTASFNIDANSIIRRTATLSIFIDEIINNITSIQNVLSINKKINLQIGYINTTNKYKQYQILWFPLGVYVINSCSITHSQTGLTASVQLKDKMCLLNGECGGTIPASTVFDNYQTIDENGDWIITRPTIYQIIQELVNHFGGQQLGKIIISDLDTRVKQVMKWVGSSPLYFLQKGSSYFMTVDANEYQTYINNGYYNVNGSPFEYGMDVGFILTDFTYPGELIGDPGSTVTDILQKIKQVLGNYEYFYDIDGNFVFQQIKNYLNNSQTQYIIRSFNEKQLVPDYINKVTDSSLSAYIIDQSQGKSVFTFDNSNLISSYSNTPQYSKIRNDFMVWGIRTFDGLDFPIRYHLAIDTKPKIGNTYLALAYIDPDDGIEKWHIPLKYDKYADLPEQGVVGTFYLVGSGKNQKIYRWEANDNTYDYILIDKTLETITTTDWRTELYFQGVMAQPYGLDSNYYYSELLNEWPKIYDIRNGKMREETVTNPSGIDFYLDFIDADSAVQELSIENIGRRSKVFNENKNVNCVFEPCVPDIILINRDYSEGEDKKGYPAYLRQECQDRGLNFYQVDGNIYNALEIGGMFNSAYEIIKQLLYEYTSYNESISIQTIPLYHLEPNTRITVQDTKSNIFGDYIITNMNFNIDVSSTLTINAIKALEKI